jgi:hypothetical protein
MYRGSNTMSLVPPGHARRREAVSSVAPISN